MSLQHPVLIWGLFILFFAVSLWTAVAYTRVVNRMERLLRRPKDRPLAAPAGEDAP